MRVAGSTGGPFLCRMIWTPARCGTKLPLACKSSFENWSPNPPGDLFFRPDARRVFYAIMAPMPRDGAIILSDLVGKLDVLHVHCQKCGRAGRYHLDRLIKERGRNARLIDWLGEITAVAQRRSRTT